MQGERWGRQARWWAGHAHERAVRAVIGRMPARTRSLLVDALERRDAPLEVDLTWVSAFRDSCVVEEHRVAETVPDGSDGRRGWAERHAYRLRECRVDLATSLTFHRGRVIAASGSGWRSARDGAFLSGAAARVAAAERVWPGPLAPMGTVHNYFHFVLETLPRLLHLRGLAPDVPAVFAGPVPGYAVDVLTTLGVAYRVVEDPAPVLAGEVWLCEPIPADQPHPVDLDVLRRAVAAAVPGGWSGAGALYLSRRMSSRSIESEEDVERYLAANGFRILFMQAMPFAEQVRAMRGARVVVGPHGAALANLAFGAAGLRVVELTAGDWWRPTYRNLAAVCGQQYRLVRLPWSPDHPDGRAADAIVRLGEVPGIIDAAN